ncbi:beta-galactosidase [Candidatus Uhrbacteria bacterium]|nr:beta-galactosidase [Candidatus Uhrbacteria bacterium]
MHRIFSWKRAHLALAMTVGVLFLGYAILWLFPPATATPEWGVTFSQPHASWLGLNWRDVYGALLDDLHVRHIRTSAYWNWIEDRDDGWRFDDLDWQLDEAARRGATVILAVGRRLPRWPECHVSDWARMLPNVRQQEELLEYVRTVVERYRGHPALARWQVENEPLLSVFGECPPPDRAFLEREIALVRSLDPAHPILLTDSGELSMWMRTAALGDVLGTTMYRVVWNPLVGYWSYDRLIPPAFYRLKALLAGKPASRMIIAELQAEPWIPKGQLRDTPIPEQRSSMDADRLRRHAAFARATGFSEAYFWGIEYWYWLNAKQHDPSLWDAARTIIAP